MNQQSKSASAAMPLSAGELADSVAAPAASKSTVPPSTAPPLALQSFQQLIRRMYFEKDVARGIDGTFMWLMEEVGELAAALRSGTHAERLGEFADVLAWLATIANVAGVDLAEAVALKYGTGCPGCGQLICQCADAEKP
jgi:NTP pyrophosphatase (non-canonical NTP hydrolase)